MNIFVSYSLPCSNTICHRFRGEKTPHIDIAMPCLLDNTEPNIVGKWDFLIRSEKWKLYNIYVRYRCIQ